MEVAGSRAGDGELLLRGRFRWPTGLSGQRGYVGISLNFRCGVKSNIARLVPYS
jgi:hypothetical protein